MLRQISMIGIFIMMLPTTIFSQTLNEKLSQELTQIVQSSSLQGFGVAIFNSDTMLYSQGFGNASEQQKYVPTTRQKIASISKLVLGVAVMKAQEMQLFQLNDPVNDYLPFPLIHPYHTDQAITIRHLATHTAGLAKLPKYDLKAIYSQTEIPKIKKELPFGLRKLIFNKYIKQINTNQDISLNDFLSQLYASDGEWYSKKHFLKQAPGQETCYSNAGASLLALIIEKASGITYADFVQQHIFNPLNLQNTSFDFQRDAATTPLAATYHAGIEMDNNFKLLVYPAGGLETTITDFYRFMSAIIAGIEGESPILSKASIQELLHPQFGNLHYGVLWSISSSGYIGHGGDLIGVTTFAYYHVDQKMGYLLFSNTAGTPTSNRELSDIKSVLRRYFDQFSD